MAAFPSLTQLLETHPEISRVEAFLVDVNGIARGKWLPRDKALEIETKGLPLPRSAYALDLWGRDAEAPGKAFAVGDPDGLYYPVPGTAVLMPWAARPTAQVMMGMRGSDGTPYSSDPRTVLANVTAKLATHGLQPIVATELEFYLLDPRPDAPARPPHAGTDPWAERRGQVLAVDALRLHEALFDDISDACEVQRVPYETILRENGAGQYEINLRHVADPCAAADHAVLLKRIVKGMAIRHGLRATFMAKPDGARSGSGMHIHVSLVDGNGRPAFAEADGAPTAMLYHGVAGLLNRLSETMLCLAPHANSYRRFRANSLAPTHLKWGIDDRSAAIRVIVGGASATRIEQRIAGADCNPYLVVATTLAAILDGIERGEAPPAAEAPAPLLPREWGVAIDLFAGSTYVADRFGEVFRDLLVGCKRQDFDEMLTRVSNVELDSCLDIL